MTKDKQKIDKNPLFLLILHRPRLRKINGQGPLAGDQIYIAAPCLIMSAHGFAEACRLSATLAGAINNGGFAWIPTTCLGVPGRCKLLMKVGELNVVTVGSGGTNGFHILSSQKAY